MPVAALPAASTARPAARATPAVGSPRCLGAIPAVTPAVPTVGKLFQTNSILP
jgi:hypothetical protein